MTDDELQRMFVLDDGPGPALALDAAQADAIVEAALVGAGFGPGGGSGGASSGGSAASGASTLAKGKLVLLGGAVALVVIAAIAWRATRGRSQTFVLDPDAAVLDASAGTGTATNYDPAERDAGGAEPATDRAPDAPEAAPDEAIEIEAATPDRAPPARPARPERDRAETETAADLLGAANAKRAAKQWRASDELYARVVERAPNTLAAQTALVASASLHLEHLGDPKGAARRFSRALAIAPRGALAEDARWGLAEAARALHDTAAEKAALDDFLAHHASSPLAARAKARRAELP